MVARLKGPIKLICSGCGKEQDYDRDIDADIPNCVKTIVSQCPECNVATAVGGHPLVAAEKERESAVSELAAYLEPRLK